MNSSNKINLFQEDISINLPDFFVQNISIDLARMIKAEGKNIGEISIILCSDKYILNINNQYLNHDYYTDVITFNYNEDKVISGDLFIGVETVKSNSDKLKTNFHTELKRVIIHGVLHLLGYNDKTDKEVKEIRAKEDFYLTSLSEKI